MKRNINNFRRTSSDGGFTILELLASMSILLIMVGFLAVAFNAASTAWRQGEHDVDRAQAARTTVDLMARDLSQAIVSPHLQFYGSGSDVAFVAPVNDDGSAPDIAEIAYVLYGSQPPYRLVRRFTPTTDNVNWDVYSNPGNWPATAQSESTICDTVMSLTLTYYDTNSPNAHLYSYWNSTVNPNEWVDPILGTVVPSQGLPIMSNTPPAFVNIHLEVTDSKTAALLGSLTNSASTSTAYINLTNRATRSFDAYVQIPQR